MEESVRRSFDSLLKSKKRTPGTIIIVFLSSSIILLVAMFQVVRAIKYDRTANERNTIRESSAISTSSPRGGGLF